MSLDNWDINSDWLLPEKYDLIICTRCAYFSKDPADFIQKCKSILKPMGWLFVDWGLGDHWRFKNYKVGWLKDREHEYAAYNNFKSYVMSAVWNDKWEENQEVIYQSIAGVIFFTGSLILYFVWNTWARDPKIRKPIVRQYDAPKGMKPAEIIRLKNNYPTTVEITATIISLAQQGFININKIKKYNKQINSLELTLQNIK